MKKYPQKSFLDRVAEANPGLADIVTEIKSEQAVARLSPIATQRGGARQGSMPSAERAAPPIVPAYLEAALQSEVRVAGSELKQHSVGDLLLPTGRLVACDPVAYPRTEAFSVVLPKGRFSVSLSVAQTQVDQRTAFATIRFRATAPVKWEILAIDEATRSAGDEPGYPVDTGVAGFIDSAAAQNMMVALDADESLPEQMDAEMKKNYLPTWSWVNVPFGSGNLVAFSPGYGDGLYMTYAGFDAEGEVSCIVTDFKILV